MSLSVDLSHMAFDNSATEASGNQNGVDFDVSSNLTDALHSMSNITSPSQITTLCHNSIQTQFTQMAHLINFTLEKVRAKSVNETQDEACLDFSDSLDKILQLKHKLGTFQIIFGPGNYSTSAWESFRDADLYNLFISNLRESKGHAAFTIWRRHSHSFVQYNSKDVINKIIASTPESLIGPNLCQWIESDLMPFVIQHSSSLSSVTSWVVNLATKMEFLLPEDWPANALRMCQVIHKSHSDVYRSADERGNSTHKQLTVQICSLSSAYSSLKKEESSVFDTLWKLMEDLKSLVELKEKFNCTMSLSDFHNSDSLTIAFKILGQAETSTDIPKVVNSYLIPYARQKNLKLDKTLTFYIQELIRSYDGSSQSDSAFWEKRAISAIGCIKNLNLKCSSIIEVISNAFVPWSSEIEALFYLGIELNHPRASEIREQRRFVDLRCMLATYDLRHYNVNDVHRSKKLMFFILRSDRESALKDALLVVKAYKHLSEIEAYNYRSCFLIENNRLSEFFSLTRQLTDEERIQCFRHVVISAEIKLNKPLSEDQQLEVHKTLLFTSAAVHCLQHLIKHFPDERWESKLLDYKNILALQTEFGHYVYLEKYKSQSFRESLLSNYLRMIFIDGSSAETMKTNDPFLLDCERKRTKKQDQNLNFTHVLRLGCLLGFTPVDIRAKLALKASELGNLYWTLRFTDELYLLDPGVETGKVLYGVAHTLCKHLANESFKLSGVNKDINIPEKLIELLGRSVLICGPEMLPDALKMSTCASMIHAMFRESVEGDYDKAIKRVEDKSEDQTVKDPYSEWTFSNHFEEDGLVLESDQSMHMAYSDAMTRINKSNVEYRFPFEQDRLEGQTVGPSQREQLFQLVNSSKSIMMYLQENGLLQLSSQYILETLITAVNCASNQNVDHTVHDQETVEVIKDLSDSVNEIVQMGLPLLTRMCVKLLQKIFNQHHVDHDMALGYILLLPRPRVVELLKTEIKSAGHHYKKILSISRVAIDYAMLRDDQSLLEKFNIIETDATWGQKLAQFKISFKSAFHQNIDSKKQILLEIVKCKKVGVTLIKDYCRAYNLDETDALLKSLESRIMTTADCRDQFHHSKELDVAHSIIQEISNKNKLETSLKQLYQRVNSYDYQRLRFVLTQLERVSESETVVKGLELLNLIQRYDRVSKPSEYEASNSQNLGEELLVYQTQKLPSIASKRLPFHLLMGSEPWKIIQSELNSVTISAWLPIIKLLNLSSNQAYLMVIHNLVQSKKAEHFDDGGNANNKALCNWDIDGDVDQSMFEEIRSLISCVTDCQMAISCANWIIKQLPMGVQTVLALKGSVALTESWLEKPQELIPDSLRPTLQKAHQKFSEANLRLTTEQILYAGGVADEETLALTLQPAALIRHLYGSPWISSLLGYIPGRDNSPSTPNSTPPPIHSIVLKIAKLHGLNLMKICEDLIMEWLPSSIQSQQKEADMTLNLNSTMNTTFNLDMTLKPHSDISEDEATLQRVIYIFLQGDVESKAYFLTQYINKDLSDVSMVCLLRALRCLFALADHDLIVKLCNKSIESIRDYMQTLMYLSELENLHIQQTLSSFTKCNKAGLARGIWRNHNHEMRAVRFVADLCLDYCVYDAQLWNGILQKLLAFDQMDYLRHVLSTLTGIPQLWLVSCYKKVWMNVLTSMNTMVPPLSDQQLKTCILTSNLLHKCPSLIEMNMKKYTELSLRLELPLLALSSNRLHFNVHNTHESGDYNHINEEDNKNNLDSPSCFLETHLKRSTKNCHQLLAQLDKWYCAGLVFNDSIPVEQTVFKYVVENSLYEAIFSAKSVVLRFMKYLICYDTINAFLIYLSNSQKYEMACLLVQLFYERFPVTDERIEHYDEENQEDYLLKMYIQKAGLEADCSNFYNVSELSSPEKSVNQGSPNVSNDISYISYSFIDV